MLSQVKKNIANDKRGMVLVMSIMILTLVLTSVLALSKVILGELKMSLNTGSSVIAFHAAESGIEKGLFYIKYDRDKRNFNDFINLSNKGAGGVYPVDDSGNRSFQIATSTILGAVKDFYDISTTSPAYLDIFDPAGEVGTIDWSTTVGVPSYYQVFWHIDSCFPFHASDKLEISVTSFDQNFSNPDTQTRLVICNCGFIDDDLCDLASYSDISPNKYYRFSFRPLDSEVKEINFRMRDSTHHELRIMSSALVESYGQYGNSRYRLQATIPTLTPISNIFSYVLFSEEDLTKGL